MPHALIHTQRPISLTTTKVPTAVAYTVMACLGIIYIVMACIAMACIAMAYIVMAYVVMAYIIMTYIVMAHTVMPNQVLTTAKRYTSCDFSGPHMNSCMCAPCEYLREHGRIRFPCMHASI